MAQARGPNFVPAAVQPMPVARQSIPIIQPMEGKKIEELKQDIRSINKAVIAMSEHNTRLEKAFNEQLSHSENSVKPLHTKTEDALTRLQRLEDQFSQYSALLKTVASSLEAMQVSNTQEKQEILALLRESNKARATKKVISRRKPTELPDPIEEPTEETL